MTTLTETDIRKSKLPVLLEENGAYALVVDGRVYKKLSATEKDTYRNEMRKHILHVIELSKNNPELLDAKTAKSLTREFSKAEIKDFDSLILYMNSSIPLYPSVFSNFRLLSLDDSERWAITYHLRNKEKTPENFDDVNDKFAYYHELAHALYGVKEPGADYMAAAQTLIDNPDSRGAIQMIADFRSILSVYGRFNEEDPHSNSTELAANIAINTVLAMSPKELADLAALSPEERRVSLFIAAKEFDNLVLGYESLAMQQRLKKDLEKRYDQLIESRKENNPAAVAKDLLNNNCPYPRGSVIYNLLEAYAGARERQLVNNYAELYPVKAPSKLQQEWEAIATPKSEEPGTTAPAPANPIKPGR